MRRHLTILALLAAGLLAGCGTPPIDPAGPTVARISVDGQDQYDHLWESTAEALRHYSLPPDRQDRVEGLITTHPETSAAFFEFWRPQPRPAYLWWESNIHTIQRTATVRLKASSQPSECEVDVQVDRLRYSFEERQVTNPAAAMRLYGSAAPTVSSGQFRTPEESGGWVRLGRDEDMENRVLNEILTRYARPPVSTQPH